MILPNFLIIGAARAGTTALYRYLQQHPEIYMSPIKEPNFFAVTDGETDSDHPDHLMKRRFPRGSTAVVRITDLETYSALFRPGTGRLAIGEASPSYLITPGTPERIKRLLPDVKLIAILRDPVDRAYSAHSLRWLYGGQERAPFGQAVRDIHWGFYYTHLKGYFDTFDRAQIGIHIYADFRANPVGTLQDIFRFLGVSESFVPDVSVQHNVGGVPKNGGWRAFFQCLSAIQPMFKQLVPDALRPGITDLLSRLQRQALAKSPPLEPGVRDELIHIYREDILKLQDLVQRDLSHWLQ